MSNNHKLKKTACRMNILLVLGFLFLLFIPLARTASARIDNNYQENSPLVLFDDNIGFWNVKGAGQGRLNAIIASSNSTVKTGNNSLQTNLTEGQYNYIEVGHHFNTAQNWSSYQNLCFWFYGSNTQTNIEIAIAAPDSYHQFWFLFNDDFYGWANIVIPLASMDMIGTANFTNIQEIGFFFYDAPSTFNVDRLILDIDPQATTQPTQSPFIPIYSTNTPTTSISSTFPSPSAKLPEWLAENWRWIILLTAILTIIIVQVVLKIRKYRS